MNAVIAEATTVGKPASQYKVNKDGVSILLFLNKPVVFSQKMSQAFLDAVAKNKDNKNKVSIKSKTQKSPNANDVVDSLVGKDKTSGKEQTDLTDAKEEKDPVDGEKGDAKVEKKDEE